MKGVQFNRFGIAHDVTCLADLADPGPPGPREVCVEVEAFPINPVDLLTIAGKYAVRPPLPAIPGSEAVARVTAIGHLVTAVAPGDRVLLMGRECWVQHKVVPETEVLRIGVRADPLQLAMLKINPATAWLLLHRFRKPDAGAWLIQNAANSGVGMDVVKLARRAGARTVNVVRRAEAAQDLLDAGADAVVVDGPDLAAAVAAETRGANIQLALDAVAGSATSRLAGCLGEGATVVNYGLLSGQPCSLDPGDIVFRGISLTGFWLVRFLGAMPANEKSALYGELAALVARGELGTRVEAVYELDDIVPALAHAAREHRRGKILVTANGPVSA